MAIFISVLLVAGLAASYFYYPVYKANEHAKRHAVMMNYLGEIYPGDTLNVMPETYEDGDTVGRFDISYIDTPEMGVTLQVNHDGDIVQTSSWTEGTTPEQEELWREILFFYGDEYTLNKQLPELRKVDQYIDGELTVFALKINDAPAIAVYNYNQESYVQLAFEEGEQDEFVQIETDGHIFVYADEDFQGNEINLSSIDEPLNISDQKGKLIIHKNEGE